MNSASEGHSLAAEDWLARSGFGVEGGGSNSTGDPGTGLFSPSQSVTMTMVSIMLAIIISLFLDTVDASIGVLGHFSSKSLGWLLQVH